MEALAPATEAHMRAVLLAPTSIELRLWQCVQPDNPDLPKLKLAGTLSSLRLRITARRFVASVALFMFFF